MKNIVNSGAVVGAVSGSGTSAYPIASGARIAPRKAQALVHRAMFAGAASAADGGWSAANAEAARIRRAPRASVSSSRYREDSR